MGDLVTVLYILRCELAHRRSVGGENDTNLHCTECLSSGFRAMIYSHSIVAGGFDVMSYATRFTPGTSATMRPEILASTS